MTYKPVEPVEQHTKWVGTAVNFRFEVQDEDYRQAEGLWNVLGKTPGQQENFVSNVAGHLCAALPEVRGRTYDMFGKVNKDLGARIAKATEEKAVEAPSQANGHAEPVIR